MSYCHFFAKNKENPNFIIFLQKNKCNCTHSSDSTYLHKDCPYIWECASFNSDEFRVYTPKNVVFNSYGEKKEILSFKKDLRVLEKAVNIHTDTSRSFLEYGDYLIPKKTTSNLDSLNVSMTRNRKRATERYFGYAYCNEWTHFFTFTLSPYLVEHREDSFNAKKCWECIRKALQRFDPDVRILCVPEKHESGVLHFHALVGFTKPLPCFNYKKLPSKQIFRKTINGNVVSEGFCTFDKQGRLTCPPKSNHPYFLMPYYEYGMQKYTKLGDPLYATNFYPYGINSCAILPPLNDNLAVVNYLVNYTNKTDTIGYNDKRYYHTHNLLFKDKTVEYVADAEQLSGYISSDMFIYKDNDRMTVYRNFGGIRNDT